MQTWDRYLRLMLPVSLILMILGVASVSWGMTPEVAAGGNHTVSLRSDGTLWASGLNVFGQLGDGSTTSRNTPVQVGTASNWAAVAAGADHSLALKADGSLWAWGSNQFSQLGNGSGGTQKSPVRIGTANDWLAVAAGGSSSFALKADGTLWAWGRNDAGQLGTGNTAAVPVPAPVQNAGLSNYVAVATGGSHTLALQADGSLWAWGSNQFGQLAQSPVNLTPHPVPAQVGFDSDWIAISAGGLHSMALKADGSLWAWGDNQFGQLGQGVTDLTPHDIPGLVGTATDWAFLSAGDLHSLAVKRNGTVWVWGDNTSGQLGDGTTADRAIPFPISAPAEFTDVVSVAAGTTHSMAISAQGNIFGWGDNGTGQLGNGTTVGSLAPIPVGTDTVSWVGAKGGGGFTIARQSDGTLWTWGDNSSGQLGDNNNTFVPRLVPEKVGTATNWISHSAGWSHAVALRADGTLWTWGDNSSGQLGDGTTNNTQAPGQIVVTQPASAANNWKSVAAGDFHNLALKADGTLWAWGNNSFGQLGDGTTTNQPVPVQVVTGNPGNFDNHWVAIAAGGSHSLGLQADGTLWVWGDNGSGQLGDPALGTAVSTPSQVVNFTPPTTGFNSSWVAIDAGLGHSLALQADGTLWAWGSNFSGQLGNGDATTPNPPDQPSPVQVANPGASPYVAVAAGDSHSAARQANGTLWSWGNNTSGQLGNGTTDPDPLAPVPHPTPTPQITADWVALDAGGSHAVALKSAGTLWTWGNNASGQLGDGTSTTQNTPVQIVVNPAAPLATINAAAAANGAISPSGAVALTQGTNQTFTITPNAGYVVAALVVDGAVLPGATTHTFTNVTGGGHYINAYFAPSDVAINAAAAANGVISPAGATPVTPGSNQTFAITPDSGFIVAALVVDGTQLPGAATHTFTNVTGNHYINAYFAPSGISISAAAGANGSISPAGSAAVTPGRNYTYTITPDPGFAVSALVVDGTLLPGATTHTFTSVAGSHYINAYFAQAVTFTITAASAGNGSISPAGAAVVTPGSAQTYTITPNAGFVVSALVVDGQLLPGATTHTFTNVTGDHYINAYFAPPTTFTINAAAAANGIISPAGATAVTPGGAQAYTITPDPGFAVSALVVDGTLLPGAATHTFTNVTGDHYINAYFAPSSPFTITAAAAPGGSISPAGAVAATPGSDVTFTITPDPGLSVSTLVVDDVLLPGATSHTFTNVQGNHYINAYFQ
jgi:alpha-tubulin suppressor-like RCC1 family protein